VSAPPSTGPSEGYRAYAGEDIVTGEGVAVELPVASVPLRMASGAIDLVVMVVALIVVSLLVGILTAQASEAVAATFVVIAIVVVTVVLPTTIETLSKGRSLGRLIMGLRVVRDDGGPVTARHALTRALVGVVEVLALSGMPAVVAAMVHPRGKRLGDMAAGTYAVSQRAKLRMTAPPLLPAGFHGWAQVVDIGALPAGLTIATRQFLLRAHGLGPSARQALGQELLTEALRHVSPAPPPGHHPETVLAAILATRRQRDADRLAREQRLRERYLR